MDVTTAIDTVASNIVAFVVLSALLTIACVVSVRFFAGRVVNRLETDLRDIYRDAVRRHAELSSALELVKQYRADPDLPAKLAGFSRETVLAVLTLRVTALRGDIEFQQRKLSTYRRDAYNYGIPGVELQLKVLWEELRLADQAVQDFAAESAQS